MKRYVPSFCTVTLNHPAGENVGVVYHSEKDAAQHFAIGYSGRRGNKDFFFSFKSHQRMMQYVTETFFKSLDRRIEAKVERRAAKKAADAIPHNLKVGDIFVASWGYGQTNVDFYRVTEVKAKSVVVAEMNSIMVETHDSMSGRCAPDYADMPKGGKLHRVKMLSDGKPALRMNSYKYAFLHETGKTHYCSWCH